MSGFNISQLTPAFKKISEGKQSAIRIFEIIDREPKIKNPENGIKIANIKGIIKFENVTFSYPRDKSKTIFSSINL
jgi:ABC-type multidrug transport system fused ATPase/permease subunit